MAGIEIHEAGNEASGDDTSVSNGAENPHLRLGNDEDEWEYEYSSTDTDTFYVTLDLSTADFTTRQTTVTPNGRGGFKLASLHENSAKQAAVPPDSAVSERSGAEANVDESNDTDGEERAEKVQIMDLHSANPIISYRGRVFQGQWSQNIGTELLMTQRDQSNPLPALRHLDNEVELLAASASRINVTQKELKPKDDSSTQDRDEEDADVAAQAVPRAEQGASKARIRQGDFISKLIDLKKRKGETDEVTVIAESSASRKESGPKRQMRPYRRKVPGRTRRTEGTAGVRAPRRGGRARGRPRGDPPRFPFRFEGSDGAADSTPTPTHWDELDKNDGGGTSSTRGDDQRFATINEDPEDDDGDVDMADATPMEVDEG